MADDIPYYYLFVYSKLRNKAGNDGYISTVDALKTIRNECKPSSMPSNLWYHMLSQMEKYGLVRKIHRFKYQIVSKKIDLKGFDKKETFNDYKDDFQKCISSINKQGVIHCKDDCLYQILPSKELKKLNELSCWFVKA